MPVFAVTVCGAILDIADIKNDSDPFARTTEYKATLHHSLILSWFLPLTRILELVSISAALDLPQS